MTSLDAVFIVVFVIFFARGIWTGLVSQLAFLAALVLGFAAAGSFYEKLSPLTLKFVDHPKAAFFVTFALLFLLVYLIVIFTGRGLKRVVKISMLGWVDRLMGGVLGLGKALFLTTLVFMVMSAVMSDSNSYLRKAYSYPMYVRASEGMMQFIKDKDLRENFRPKDPAISSIFALQSNITMQNRERVITENSKRLQELREQLAREAKERIESNNMPTAE